MGLRDKMKGPGAREPAKQPAQPRHEPLVEEKPASLRPPAQPLMEPPPSAPVAASPITMVLDDDALLSATPAKPQAPPPRPNGVDLSPGGIAKMLPEALVSAAVSELQSRRISDEDGFMDERDLRALYKAVRDNGLLGQVFARAAEPARAENPTRVENAVRRPPPPPPRRSSMPPRPAPASAREQITGEEATVAAPPESLPHPPQQAVPQPPVAEVAAFMEAQGKDLRLNAAQKLGKAREFYDGRLNELLAQCGGDDERLKKMIIAHQQSATAKKEARQPLTPMEQYILLLTQLSSEIAKLEKKLRSEQEVQELLAKKKSQMPGALPRIPSPDKENKPAAESIRPPAESIRPPPDVGQKAEAAAPASRQPSPDRPSKRPASKDPVPAEKEERNGRMSEPPQSGPANPRKGRGAFARFMLSPITWTTVCVGGFTAAMLATHGFDDMAQFFNTGMARIPAAAPYIRRVWEGWLHLPPLESAAGSEALYYGLTGLGVLGGLYRKYRRVRKKERELTDLGIGEENFQRMRNYVVPILHRIFDEYGEGTYPKKLRTKLIEDPKFFMYMEEIYRNPAKFGYIMKEADVPPKHVAKFHVVFNDAENELVKMRLEDYVKYIDDPGLRLTNLREIYGRDELFRKKLDEIFQKNFADEYVNPKKQTDVAKALGNGDSDKGLPILKKLEMDYLRLTETKEKKDKKERR